MCNCVCHALPLFVYVSLPLFVFQTYHLIPFLSLHRSVLVLSPPPSAHPQLSPPSSTFSLTLCPLCLPSARTHSSSTSAEVPLSQCAAGPTMKMCNVWHSRNESPNRRGSGYHRAPSGPSSVCLTLIMAHANECAALKSGEACLTLRVEGLCVSVCKRLFCSRACLRVHTSYVVYVTVKVNM